MTNTITVSSPNTSSTTYTLSPTVTSANAIWTTTGTTTDWNALSINGSTRPSGTLSLQGEDADIDLNGKSMREWMEKVEEKLNILTVNPKLESEWQELKVLGEQYRALEQHIIKKMKTWDKLKAQDTDNR